MARRPDYSRFFQDDDSGKKSNGASTGRGVSTGSNAKNVYNRTVSNSGKNNSKSSNTSRGKSSRSSGSGSNGGKRKSGKKVSIWKRLIVSFIILAIVGACVGGSWVVAVALSAEPITDAMLNVENVQTSIVYDKSGEKIDYLTSIDNIDRTIIPYDKMSKNVVNAIVAIEDERFYKHNGFDPYAFFRAAVKKVTSPGNREGGSTITMQLVKNITGKSAYDLGRKIQEQYLAMNLETRLAKWQILEKYLNLIPLGGNTYGVEAAAKRYFNKSASELTVGEAASIAAIPKAPYTYAPLSKAAKARNIDRAKLVLQAMYKNNYITKEQLDYAWAHPPKFKVDAENKRSNSSIKTYFTDYVVRQLYKDLEKKGFTKDGATQLIFGGGLQVYTTMDKTVQDKMDTVFNTPSYFPHASSGGQKVQGSMVIIDPQTGQIRALYGGNGKKTGNMTLDRATMIQRQPGSSIKPIAVYGPAIDTHAITGGEVIDDTPCWMLGNSTLYPVNASGTYKGLTTLRDGIKNSVNVVAAKVYQKMSPSTPLEYLKRVGIVRTQKTLSLALGGMDQGVNPLLMAGAYVPFDNEGIYLEPICYTKVVDRSGTVLIDKLQDPDLVQKKNVVYDAKTASIMTNLMEDVVTSGTAAYYGKVKNGAIESAGKTGTTNDTKDKWFVGFTPYYVGAVWYGYDNNAKLAYDSGQALKIWHAVMNSVHQKLPAKKFIMAPGLIKMKVCTKSGDLPGPYCETTTAYFIPGTEPTKKCTVHVRLEVCSQKKNGRYYLAGPDCTPIMKTFIKRKVPYKPKFGSGRYPQDWWQEAPTQYCNGIHTSNKPKPTTAPVTTDPPTNVVPTEPPEIIIN